MNEPVAWLYEDELGHREVSKHRWVGTGAYTETPLQPDGWRCYWCNGLFTDRAKAEIHFGPAHGGQTAPECYRYMERKARDLEAKLAAPVPAREWADATEAAAKKCEDFEPPWIWERDEPVVHAVTRALEECAAAIRGKGG